MRVVRAGSRLRWSLPVLAIALPLALFPVLAWADSHWTQWSQQGVDSFNDKRYEEAAGHFSKAIEAHGARDEIHGSLFGIRGESFYRLKRYAEAAQDFSEALNFLAAPEQVAKVLRLRGIAFYRLKSYVESEADFSRAIELFPDGLLNYVSRGETRKFLRQFSGALDDFQKAIDLAPERPEGYNAKAWTLATCPRISCRDGAEAVRLGERALELWKASVILNTVSAAYAEAGDYPKAIATITRGIALLAEEGRQSARPLYERMLRSYQAGKPWRDPPPE